MKVLFIIPRSLNPKQMYKEYPLGVGLIGTSLKNRGVQVSIFDQNVEGGNEQDVLNLVRKFVPDIIGFSLMTPNYPVAKSLIRNIKIEFSNILIISGGIHTTIFPKDLLIDGSDIAVCGEGVQSMLHIVDYFQKKISFDKLPGVTKTDMGYILKLNNSIYPQNNIQKYYIDRSLFNLNKYTHHSMFGSIGCPFNCFFCCNYSGTILKKGLKIRQYQDIINEIIYLRDSYNAKQIFFVDDIFLINKYENKKFCTEMIKRKINMSWIAQMRANAIDYDLASLMAEAGCLRIYFGVESGSDQILKSSAKGLSTKEIRKGIKATQKAGIRVKTGWIYGLPGTIEEQYASLKFMLELLPNEISIHTLIPFPGTEYYINSHKYGIRIIDKKNFKSFCYGGIDDNISFDYLQKSDLLKLYEITEQELEKSGYINSDLVTDPSEKYVYTTPFTSKTLSVFSKK